MRTLDEFVEIARTADLRLRVDAGQVTRISQLAGDGLFHVPLIALSILIVARARRGSLTTAELAPWTGATLFQHFSGVRAAHRKLEWSLQHRKRCADALIFLENFELVTVENKSFRTIRCSLKGLDLIGKLLRQTDEGGLLARGLDRAYRAAEHRGVELL